MRLFTGVVTPRPAWMPLSEDGTEDIRADETPDRDYGALLDRVSGKGVTSPTGFEPVFWP